MALQSRHDDFFSPAAHRKRVLNGMYITRSMVYKGHREMSILVAPLPPPKIP